MPFFILDNTIKELERCVNIQILQNNLEDEMLTSISTSFKKKFKNFRPKSNFLLFSQEHNIAAKERAMMKSENHGAKLPRPNLPGITGILFANFLALFIFTLIETLAEPLVQDEYGWSDDEAIVIVGVALAIAGMLCVTMFMVSGLLCKRFDERNVQQRLGFPLLIIGSFLLLPWGNTPMSMRCPNVTTTTEPYTFTTISTTTGTLKTTHFDTVHDKPLFLTNSDYYSHIEVTPDPDDCSDHGCPYDKQPWCENTPQIPLPQLGVAFIIIMLGYPICQSISQAVYSKMLGPRPQGLWMGLLTACGGMSRILGPIFVSHVYTFYGTYVTFGALTLAMVLAMLELTLLRKRLVPLKISKIQEINGHDGPAATEKF